MRPTAPLLLALLASACSAPRTIDESRLIDLSYAFDEHTVYWPTARSFELDTVAWGRNAAGRWYASKDYSASEHGGTHIDAPVHFAEGRWTTDAIPLDHLVAPARVIDVRAACAADTDHVLTPEDVLAHEARYGTIEPGAAVFVLTGFGRFYPDLMRYLGSDVRGDASGLHFPGIGEQAAELLVERGVHLVGIDTASLDCGPSPDFPAHRVLNGANVAGLENVARLDELPPTGATVLALPMKIAGGTGGPCRIVALLP